MGAANIDDGGRCMMIVVADDEGVHCNPSLSPPHPPPSRDGAAKILSAALASKVRLM